VTHYAAIRSSPRELGIFVPDPLYVNMAKYHFAHGYHEAVRNVQDIAGGALVTGPGAEDLSAEETSRHYKRFYAGREGVSGDDRLRALALVKDLVASEFATYQEVLAVHAEGSLEAEKLMLLRSYDPASALAFVRRMAGISHGDSLGSCWVRGARCRCWVLALLRFALSTGATGSRTRLRCPGMSQMIDQACGCVGRSIGESFDPMPWRHLGGARILDDGTERIPLRCFVDRNAPNRKSDRGI
jgi:4-hydroxyphenylacetate 3-hydroxylase C terminal